MDFELKNFLEIALNLLKIGLLIFVGFLFVKLAKYIFIRIMTGFACIFEYAKEHDFVGVALFIIILVIAFPLVVLWAFVWGWQERQEDN